MCLMEFSMTPVGEHESVSPYVAKVVNVVRNSGLPFQLNAMGTLVEGELCDLLALIEKCFAVLAADCPRISCSVKFDYREGASEQLHGKVKSVEDKLGVKLSQPE